MGPAITPTGRVMAPQRFLHGVPGTGRAHARDPRQFPGSASDCRRGSRLCDPVTGRPEYYPTRIETATLRATADQTAQRVAIEYPWTDGHLPFSLHLLQTGDAHES